MTRIRRILQHRWGAIAAGCLMLAIGLGWAMPAIATVHTYAEQPGQVTFRSQQSLRDQRDRAWQAVAFNRYRHGAQQGVYLRLVGFPGGVEVDAARSLSLLAPTGQHWQLLPQRDPQTAALPISVGQYNLAPLLQDLAGRPVPLEIQVPLVNDDPAQLTAAPFVVQEWVEIGAMTPSPAPVRSPLGEQPHEEGNDLGLTEPHQ
ncbi:MAG: DUF3122 domain-containing protein [Leptolyngbyaceae cyanobacterium T60_A2020_046]|nr:DUF3122 domain-containing protein [Leptolyngbyaceae cyanobacterium T60_A2020_046]